MGYKTKILALLGAAENVVKYHNLYEQWIVTPTIETGICRQENGYCISDNDGRLLIMGALLGRMIGLS